MQQTRPSVQRLLDRLADTPVGVYDATWTLLAANPPYDALMGDTRSWAGIERNAVWWNFVGPGSRVAHTPDELADLRVGQVADLRRTAARYPADGRLRELIGRLRTGSAQFAELWDSGADPGGAVTSRRKVVDHPEVGPIGVDCDVLVIAADELRVMVYSAEPGSADAQRLALAVVIGTQHLVG